MKSFFISLILWLLAWSCFADGEPWLESVSESPLNSTTLSPTPLSVTPTDHLLALEPEDNNLHLPMGEASTVLPTSGLDEALNFATSVDDDPLGGDFEILPPDRAFVFSVRLENPNILVANWHIAEGHYLYRDQFKFALKGGGILGEPQFPQGIIKTDIKYGQVEVYETNLTIQLPIKAAQDLTTVTLETHYQGCAESRLCYPPIEKTTIVNLPNTYSTTPVTTEISLNQDPINNNPIVTDDSKQPRSFLTLPVWLADLFNQLGRWLGLNSNKNQFLDPDEAFILSAEFTDPTYLTLRWQIATGYYLYRDKLQFSLQSQGTLGTPQLPPSTLKQDPQFGQVEVYQQPRLEVTIPIQIEAGLSFVTLQVKYQGCAVAGLCYPPITKVVNLTFGKVENLSEQDRIAYLLANANLLYTMLMFFGLGLLLAFTPCVFPMIPILSALIMGQGLQATTYKSFVMSMTYVLSMALTYALAGVVTGLLGENLQATFQNPWILTIFVLIFIGLSLSMFGFYELQIPNALQTKLVRLSNRQQGGTLIGVAIMGALSALIVGPCVAAPLVGALIYIGQTGDAILGGSALFSMGLGMGVPLILVGTSAGHWLPKAGQWMDVIKAVFGVMLLAIAIWILDRIVPGQVTMLLLAALLIVSAIYMGALDNIKIGVSGWRRLWKGLGIILLVYGILLMIGAASGRVNLWQPLYNTNINDVMENPSPTPVNLHFKPIKGKSGLERELAVAQTQNKPVMLDFYADWCVSCKELEHFTFTDAKVQELLAHFILLQADVTQNDEQDKNLYKHFGIYGPPAILFFKPSGQEQRAYRVVGFMPADKFHQHLKKVLQP